MSRAEPAAAASTAFEPDRRLDIVGDLCPMTFVRTRLALDQMSAGESLLVVLRGEEPRRNLPQAVRELGHTVLAEATRADGTTELLIRKAG